MLYALSSSLEEQKYIKEEEDEDLDLENSQTEGKCQSRTNVKQNKAQQPRHNDRLVIKQSSKEKDVYDKFLRAKQQCANRKSKTNSNKKSELNEINNIENLFGNAFAELSTRFENVETKCNNIWKNQALSLKPQSKKKTVSSISIMNDVIKDFEKMNSLYEKYQTEMSNNYKIIDQKLIEIKKSVESCIKDKFKHENNDLSNVNFQLQLFETKQTVGYWESDVIMMQQWKGTRIHISGYPPGPSSQWSPKQFEALTYSIIQWPNEKLTPNRDIMYLLPNEHVKRSQSKSKSKSAAAASINLKQCRLLIHQTGIYRINCVMKKSEIANEQLKNGNFKDKNHIVTHKRESGSNCKYETTDLYINKKLIEYRSWDDGKSIHKIEITTVTQLDKDDTISLVVCHGLAQRLISSLLVEKLG